MESNFKEPRPLYREGKKVEMYQIIEDLDMEYQSNLKASVCVGESYEEVSEETRNDLNIIRKALELLEKLGYITNEERNAMLYEAERMRIQVLDDLEEYDEFTNR